MGTAGRMGPGYFPTVLGGLLALIGVICLIRSFFSTGEAVGKVPVKEIILVIVGVLMFGLTVRGAGMIPAVFILVLISSLAGFSFRLLPTLYMATGSAAFCWLVFVYLLGLPIQAFGSWFGF